MKSSIAVWQQAAGGMRSGLIQLILQTGWTGHMLVFFGGVYQFSSAIVDRVYALCWALCFATCASACFANLWFCTSPYHNLSSDMLTAYIHVPVFLAWCLWRRALRTKHFQTISSPLKALSGEERRKMDLVLWIYVQLTFITMILVSLLVLAAYALPPTIDVLAHGRQLAAKKKNDASGDAGANRTRFESCFMMQAELANAGSMSYNMSGDELVQVASSGLALLSLQNFMLFHAVAMFFVIPPVVCVTLCIYSMILLVFAIHLIDLYRLSIFINAALSRFQTPLLVAAVADGDLVMLKSDTSDQGGGGAAGPTGSLMLAVNGMPTWDSASLRTRSNVSCKDLRYSLNGKDSVEGASLTESVMALNLIIRALRSRIRWKRALKGEQPMQEPPPNDLQLAKGLSHASVRIAQADGSGATTTSTPTADAETGRATDWTRVRSGSAAEASPHPAQSSRNRFDELSSMGSAQAHRDHCEFCSVMDRIVSEAARRQSRLNTTCDQTSFTYLHLLLFNSVRRGTSAFTVHSFGPTCP